MRPGSALLLLAVAWLVASCADMKFERCTDGHWRGWDEQRSCERVIADYYRKRGL